MDRLIKRTFALIAFSIGTSFVGSAAAEEPVTTPSLDTKGKPLNPPAPATGVTPKLGGLSAFAGVAILGMGPVNDRLQEQRALYPSDLPMVFPLLGGQGFGLFSHFLIGGSGAGLLSRSVDAANDRQISASGAWGTFDFGYQLLRVNGFLIAPVLSLGGYGMHVTVSPKTPVDFNEALANPTRSLTLSNSGFLTGISVVAKTVLLGKPTTNTPNARTGWALGLRLGALYGFPLRGWRSNGEEVTGDPPFGLRGGYAALSLGAGSW
ncbi:MAG TPA: hypothetical protein VFK05_35720 [Polyangiaceae bacterium]|nr:hypothetical protein [Polyangiaceae bacterium]